MHPMYIITQLQAIEMFSCSDKFTSRVSVQFDLADTAWTFMDSWSLSCCMSYILFISSSGCPLWQCSFNANPKRKDSFSRTHCSGFSKYKRSQQFHRCSLWLINLVSEPVGSHVRQTTQSKLHTSKPSNNPVCYLHLVWLYIRIHPWCLKRFFLVVCVFCLCLTRTGSLLLTLVHWFKSHAELLIYVQS